MRGLSSGGLILGTSQGCELKMPDLYVRNRQISLGLV
jgi:hypothetical protein